MTRKIENAYTRKVKTLQAKFNPDKPDDLSVIEYWFKQRERGVSDKDLITFAINQLDGKNITSANQQAMMRKLSRIEDKIDQQSAFLYEQVWNVLQGIDLGSYVHTSTGRSIQQELGDKLPPEAYKQVLETMKGEEFDV